MARHLLGGVGDQSSANIVARSWRLCVAAEHLRSAELVRAQRCPWARYAQGERGTRHRACRACFKHVSVNTTGSVPVLSTFGSRLCVFSNKRVKRAANTLFVGLPHCSSWHVSQFETDAPETLDIVHWQILQECCARQNVKSFVFHVSGQVLLETISLANNNLSSVVIEMSRHQGTESVVNLLARCLVEAVGLHSVCHGCKQLFLGKRRHGDTGCCPLAHGFGGVKVRHDAVHEEAVNGIILRSLRKFDLTIISQKFNIFKRVTCLVCTVRLGGTSWSSSSNAC